MAGPRLLGGFAAANPEAFFIEIGSNDGDKFDHLSPLIRSGGWRGIMIEPVPYVFERLRRNYGGIGRVALENAAIADEDGHLPFYHLAEAKDDEGSELPAWYDCIGSFSRDALLSHSGKIPDLESRVVCIDVPCLTFDSLCQKHQVERVDLLLIDTEGYDWEIIKSIDLARHRPQLLVYEHYHLPAAVRRECTERLESLGYETLPEGFDTLCLRMAGADDQLTRIWRGLRPAVPVFSVDENPA